MIPTTERNTDADRRSAERSRPPRRIGAIVFDAALLAALLYLLPQTLALNATSRRFPLLALGVTSGLVAVDLLVEAFPRTQHWLSVFYDDVLKVDTSVGGTEREQPDDEGEATREAVARQPTGPRWRREFIAVGWLLVTGIGMFLFGYLVLTPIVLLGVYLWFRVSPRVWVPVTAVMTLLNWLVFYEFLGLG